MKTKDMLYALWTQTHDDTGWLQLSTYIKYRRKNGWVYVHIENLPKPSSNVIGTLPVGFRPVGIITQLYLRTNAGATIPTWIPESGAINVNTGFIPSSATYLAGFVAYPV